MGDLKGLADKLKSKGISVEYIDDKVKPIDAADAKLHRFVHWYFLDCDEEFFKNNADAAHEILAFRERPLINRIVLDFDETERYIAILSKNNVLNQQATTQYDFIKSLLNRLSSKDLYPYLISLMEEFLDSSELSYPIRNILLNNFGSFLLGLVKDKGKVEARDFILKRDALREKMYYLAVLALPKTDVETWVNDEEDVVPFNESEEYSIDEEYEKILCMIQPVESDVFKQLGELKFIPFYYTDDIDVCYTLIGNMIMYRSKDNPQDAVTYQIIDRIRFDTFGEMFFTLGVENFGFPDADIRELSEKCLDFYCNMRNDEQAIALRVVKT